MPDSAAFPSGFRFGAATSAYQIEGSPLADGAGRSIWHDFSHTPGNVLGNATGDVACDHYRRFADDIRLMADLGLQGYRFSLAWARLLPDGLAPSLGGRLNPDGLDFYDRLIDGLLERGIEPLATLYHWDLPTALQNRGGFVNPDSPEWFEAYARVALGRFGDRIGRWLTLNEPWCIHQLGYVDGTNAPGHRNLYEAARVIHHLLLCHGRAVRACREVCPKAEIGLTVNLTWHDPRDPDSAADRAAVARQDAFFNRVYLDPIERGRYPDELVAAYGESWPEALRDGIPADELAIIQAPTDFLGLNYYTRGVVFDDPAGGLMRVGHEPQTGKPHSEMGWETHPDGLYNLLRWLHERDPNRPLWITENGMACPDAQINEHGVVQDDDRIGYLRDHLAAVARALAEGVDVRGYFAWSLLDNYEWAYGYAKRFGLVRVDYETQQRTPKASAHWYRDLIRQHSR